ncbi:DUF4352 domain-containing protein [Lysinibacillus sp. NPDC096212]|uniref:DUF4352 domain-containing protein n=1 Tax=Lysinibacillus sp. NPDC096212 TaxID=3364135 RepID=UPI0037FCD6F6
MKKLLFSSMLVLSLGLAACGSSDGDKTKVPASEKSAEAKTISDGDIAKLYTSPKKYKDYNYSFIGKVFITPEKDDDGVYLQVYADPQKSEHNTLVAFEDPNFEVNDGDYVKIDGIVKDEFKGENMLGGSVVAPLITAKSIEVISYVDAVAPTIATLTSGEEINQHGFVVKVDKIEFAKPHTRLYLTVTNNTKDKISFFSHNVKLVSNGTQFEEETDYDADLPSIQSEILPGVSSSGVITFPAIDASTTTLQVNAEGYSDNYNLDIKPFIFTVGK